MADPIIPSRRAREQAREIWTGVPVAECSPAELERARAAGYEPDGKYFIGRDPRQLSQAELLDMGHAQLSLTQAIRAKCLDCCAGSADEVRKCVAMTCPSWPFRMGSNPWRKPMSEEQRAQRREIALRSGLGSRRQGVEPGSGDETASDAPE